MIQIHRLPSHPTNTDRFQAWVQLHSGIHFCNGPSAGEALAGLLGYLAGLGHEMFQ